MPFTVLRMQLFKRDCTAVLLQEPSKIGESRVPPLPVDYGMILELRVLKLVHVG